MGKKRIELITVSQVVEINKQIVSRERQQHTCLNRDKIESALAAAFYPGDYPFQYGGIAQVAGAICFFITKAHAFLDGNKRTAGIAATVFMEINGYDLVYPINVKKNINKFAEIIDDAAANKITKNQLIDWFEQHKRIIKN